MRRTLVAALILCVPAVVGCHSAAPAETSTPAEGGQASAAPPVARSGDWSGDQSDDTVDGGGGLELTVALEAPARVASTSRRHLGADTTLAGLVRIESATDFDAVPSLREIGDLPSGTVRRHGGDATTWVVDLPGDAPAHWLVALRTEILRQDADAEVYLRVHGGMTLGEALSAHPSPSTDASGGEIHVIGPLRPLPTHPLFRVDMHDGGRTVVDAPYREDGVDGRVELQLEGLVAGDPTADWHQLYNELFFSAMDADAGRDAVVLVRVNTRRSLQGLVTLLDVIRDARVRADGTSPVMDGGFQSRTRFLASQPNGDPLLRQVAIGVVSTP